jgi:outer membrane immunogenic protein
MKKLFLSATAIATVMSATSIATVMSAAADLPSIKSAPATPAPMWTGFYAGLNSGYGWGLTPGSYTQAPLFYDAASIKITGTPSGLGAANSGTAIINQSGFLGGGQIGYNYQIKEKFLLGIETDMQGAEISGQGYYSGAGVLADKFPNGTQDNFSTTGYGQTQASINWLGTLRGRAGYLVTPKLLTYITGGLSYGGVSTRNYFGSQTNEYTVRPNSWLLQKQQLLAGSGRASTTLMGWNIGGGAEWMFSPNWSLKSELLYYNLGSLTFSGWGYSPQTQANRSQAVVNNSTVNFAGIIARAGLNYHLNTDTGAINSLPTFLNLNSSSILNKSSTVPLSWSGIYAGLNSGYGWSGHGIQTTSDAYNQYANDFNSIERSIGPANYPGSVQPINGLAQANSGWSSVNQSGFVGGFQAGYNYQLAQNIVVGIETDIQGSTMQGSGSYTGAAKTDYWGTNFRALQDVQYMSSNGDIQAGMNWFGTLRGRVGYLITPNIMAYGTGGLSYGGVNAQTNFISASNIVDAYRAGTGQIQYEQMLSGKGQITSSLLGWNAGAGAEWMLMSNWSLKAEAIYYDLGSINLIGNGYSPTVDFGARQTYQAVNTKTSIRYDGVIARMGVNYHLDFGKSLPVVAKF